MYILATSARILMPSFIHSSRIIPARANDVNVIFRHLVRYGNFPAAQHSFAVWTIISTMSPWSSVAIWRFHWKTGQYSNQYTQVVLAFVLKMCYFHNGFWTKLKSPQCSASKNKFREKHLCSTAEIDAVDADWDSYLDIVLIWYLEKYRGWPRSYIAYGEASSPRPGTWRPMSDE